MFGDLSPGTKADAHGSPGLLFIQTTIKNHQALVGSRVVKVCGKAQARRLLRWEQGTAKIPAGGCGGSADGAALVMLTARCSQLLPPPLLSAGAAALKGNG